MSLFRYLILALLVVAASPAAAQLSEGFEGQALIRADEITYDENLNTVTARGDVEISQGGRVLAADVVNYNVGNGVVTATGNITLREPDGEVVYAEYVELKDDLREGFIRDIGILMADQTRIAAASGERQDGVRTIFRRGVFSPCKLCREDPSRAPLWQIKAAEVEHDQEERVIRYHDAWMEFFGIPFLYTPYLEHPDPTVDRKSGFLAPTFGYSQDLGATFQIPYFWAISPDKDLTFEPIITSKQTVVLAGEYRQLFQKGELVLEGSGTIADREVRRGREDVLQKDRLRGHITGFGRFDIDEKWRWGFDVNRTTDDTYLRVYDFSGDRTLTSRLFLEGFEGRNYMAANAYSFQGLRRRDDNNEFPIIAPMFDFNYVSEPGVAGGLYRVDANLAALTRIDGRDTRRLSVGAEYELPYTSPFGDIYSFIARLQADGYWTNEHDPDSTGVNSTNAMGSDFDGRILPQLALRWRYPWVQYNETFDQVIEPIAQIVLAPGGANPDTIPNEDSLGFEFDDTNIFSLNRFSGLDRIDSSSRIDYGVNWSLNGRDDGLISAFLGQSLRLSTDEDLFGSGSGLDTFVSDTVGRVRINPIREVDLLYRFRLDNNDLQLRRSELDARLGVPALNLDVTYTFIDDKASGGQFDDREELRFRINSRLTENWSLFAEKTRDLEEGRNRRIRAGITYQDECFLIEGVGSRTFFNDRDLKPEDAVFIRIIFKHLGEVSSG